MRVYLDHNATAPLRAEAKTAMIAAMELVGNPSSVHRFGQAARRQIELARVANGTLYFRLRLRPALAALAHDTTDGLPALAGGAAAKACPISLAEVRCRNKAGADRHFAELPKLLERAGLCVPASPDAG